jgi:hypothetical protein
LELAVALLPLWPIVIHVEPRCGLSMSFREDEVV